MPAHRCSVIDSRPPRRFTIWVPPWGHTNILVIFTSSLHCFWHIWQYHLSFWRPFALMRLAIAFGVRNPAFSFPIVHEFVWMNNLMSCTTDYGTRLLSACVCDNETENTLTHWLWTINSVKDYIIALQNPENFCRKVQVLLKIMSQNILVCLASHLILK